MHATTNGHILIYLAPCGTWYADMSGSIDAARYIDERDRYQVPLCFTRNSHWFTVRDAVASLHPADDVAVDILSRNTVF